MQVVFNPNIPIYHPPNSAEGLHFSAFHYIGLNLGLNHCEKIYIKTTQSGIELLVGHTFLIITLIGGAQTSICIIIEIQSRLT